MPQQGEGSTNIVARWTSYVRHPTGFPAYCITETILPGASAACQVVIPELVGVGPTLMPGEENAVSSGQAFTLQVQARVPGSNPPQVVASFNTAVTVSFGTMVSGESISQNPVSMSHRVGTTQVVLKVLDDSFTPSCCRTFALAASGATSTTRDIYRWNGKEYSLSNAKFAQYFAGDVDELIRNVHSRAPFPAPTRVNWCRQAIQIFLLQRRYAEATSLCTATLRIIDDQNLTVPNVVVKGGESNEQLDRIKMSLEVDKLKGRAEVNRLLGDTYAATGDQKLSKQHYLAAHRLEESAKEKAPALWR
jgi:hypothetical protein